MHPLLGEGRRCSLFGDSLAVSYKVNIVSPYDPAIALLGIYPKELEIYVHAIICTWIFVRASFIIAQTWMQQDVLPEVMDTYMVHPDRGRVLVLQGDEHRARRRQGGTLNVCH